MNHRHASPVIALISLLAACDAEHKPPPSIDADPCPRSTVRPVAECYDGPAPAESSSGSDSDGGSSESDSSTGESAPPTCDQFQACALACTGLSPNTDLRYPCASACEQPDIGGGFGTWIQEWVYSCATADMADDYPDAAQFCTDGLADCEHLAG